MPTHNLVTKFSLRLCKTQVPKKVGNITFLGKFQPPYRNVPVHPSNATAVHRLQSRCQVHKEWAALAAIVAKSNKGRLLLLGMWCDTYSTQRIIDKMSNKNQAQTPSDHEAANNRTL